MSIPQLTYLAVVLLSASGIGTYISNAPHWLTWFGIPAVPILLFCLVWQLDRTPDRRRFLRRLYLASVAMAGFNCAFDLLFSLDFFPPPEAPLFANIFASFFAVAVLVTLLQTKQRGLRRVGLWAAYALTQLIPLVPALFLRGSLWIDQLLPALCGSALLWDGGLLLTLLGVLLYFCKEKRGKTALVCGGYSLIHLASALTGFANIIYPSQLLMRFMARCSGLRVWDYMMEPGDHILLLDTQWMAVFALPFLLSYLKTRKDAAPNRSQRFFAFFYPAHLAALLCLGMLLNLAADL